MENPPVRRVVEALRLDGDLLLTFDDGKCAVYPATLLYDLFQDAVAVTDLDLYDQTDPYGGK
jgi:hypothetical protein